MCFILYNSLQKRIGLWVLTSIVKTFSKESSATRSTMNYYSFINSGYLSYLKIYFRQTRWNLQFFILNDNCLKWDFICQERERAKISPPEKVYGDLNFEAINFKKFLRRKKLICTSQLQNFWSFLLLFEKSSSTTSKFWASRKIIWKVITWKFLNLFNFILKNWFLKILKF